MIREWHDQRSARLWNQLGVSQRHAALSPRRAKGLGSVWQRSRTQTNRGSLHMSAQMMLILLSLTGWRRAAHGIWVRWSFECNEDIWRNAVCVFICVLTVGCSECNSHSVLCPLSPVLCLFPFLHLCIYLYTYLLSTHFSVRLTPFPLLIHTIPLFVASALQAQHPGAGSFIALSECDVLTFTYMYVHIHRHAWWFFHCLLRYNMSQSVCILFLLE